MAKNNDYQNLSQIDYCIRQYFSKYMAPTLVKETRSLQQKQNKEFYDRMEKNSSVYVPDDAQMAIANTQLKSSGKWWNKSSDDVINACTSKWVKDSKFANDYQTFLGAFYSELVRRNGGKESKELAEFAKNYVANRFESLIVEQLAREKVPKNSATYIAKKAVEDSLIGLLAPSTGPKKGSQDEAIKKKAEELYNPSTLEKAAAVGGSMAIDAAMTGGYGSGNSLIAKGATKAGVKVGAKTTAFLNSAWSGAVADGVFRAGCEAKFTRDWQNETYAKEDSKKVLGDEDAIKKIQEGAVRYKKGGTELINEVNANLSRKIKTPPLTSTDKIKKESNTLLDTHKGDSHRLVATIKSSFTKQCVPIDEGRKIPAWMLGNSAKQNRALAASFYACAMEMSRGRQPERMFGGKKMTLKEVSQRAYDYARAAEAVDRHTLHTKAKSWDTQMTELSNQINSPADQKGNASYTAQTVSASPYAQGASYTSSPTPTTTQSTTSSTSMGGWGDALEGLGLNGFSDVTRNLGYVLAMLPDMIIGMFTGKTPNLKLQDNLMPLAAIMGGLFVKNPLLKMLLIGFGGANILNKAGHAAINEGLAKSGSVAKTYKVYQDEALNPRVVNPVMKGSSMIATIDGVPSVINISTDAADAYQKGAIPLNTLANAVLKKYDENHALAAQRYEQQLSNEVDVAQQRGIK